MFVKIQKERCRELIKIYKHTEVDNDIREQVRDEVQKTMQDYWMGVLPRCPALSCLRQSDWG